MTARFTATPPKQGSPPASMDPPATPGSRSSITPTLPRTPGATVRQRTLPPATPGHSITSPFPARTPRTPGGTVTSCTADKSLFSIVTVHTAKCTECDNRNRNTMRRCPGCTFQVCKPCYERREKEGRGLMHGNAMSSPGTPTIQRTVRNKPLASTPGGRSGLVVEAEAKKEEGAVKTDGDGSDKKKATEAKATPAPRMPTGKKRAAPRKPEIEDSTSDELSDDDFESDLTSPTPIKRRRTAPAAFTRRASSSSSTEASPISDPYGCRPSSLNQNNVLYRGVLDVDTLRGEIQNEDTQNEDSKPEDVMEELRKKRFDEHFLARRGDTYPGRRAVRNPFAEKPRLTAKEIQQNIQELTHQKMNRNWARQKVNELVFKGLEAERKQAQEEAYPQTVRAFVETEAVKHRDDVAMDEDENEALISAMKDAARNWGNQTHNKLDFATQTLLRRGLDLQLEKIDGAYKAELTKLLDDCAARKLWELAQDSAPPATRSPSQATDSTQPVHGAQERFFEQV